MKRRNTPCPKCGATDKEFVVRIHDAEVEPIFVCLHCGAQFDLDGKELLTKT